MKTIYPSGILTKLHIPQEGLDNPGLRLVSAAWTGRVQVELAAVATSGSAVANFTIASTPRTFDRQSNEWKDGETLFLRASVWREAAENVAESLTKGMRVIVNGRLKSRSYDTKEGEKRTVIELEVDEIGPSLRYANAKVNRSQRNNQGGQPGSGFGGAGSRNQAAQSAAQDDPWVNPRTPATSSAGGWGSGPGSEPPF